LSIGATFTLIQLIVQMHLSDILRTNTESGFMTEALRSLLFGIARGAGQICSLKKSRGAGGPSDIAWSGCGHVVR
jgi:hypothetical protein